MSIKNTKTSYGIVGKLFHWPMALIMMGLIVVGLYMTSMEPSPDKYELYGLHKSFGILILWFIGLRVLWRFYTKPPQPHENHLFCGWAFCVFLWSITPALDRGK